MIFKQITVGVMAVYCYIVGCENTREAMIIDPGGDEDKILAEVAKERLSVKYIVATHGHPDHVCGNRRLKEATGAKIVMHKDDDAFFTRPEIAQFFSQLQLPASPPADMLVADGDTLTVGTVSLKVLHTPGHTPGGICLYTPGLVLTGDTLFVDGVGRTDFPGGSGMVLLKSIHEKLFTLPENTVVWPGHGYGGAKSTIGQEAKGDHFLGGW